MSDKRRTKKRKEEYGGHEEENKPSKEEYAVAKWLRANVYTKKTKFLHHHVEYFTGTKAVDALLTSKWATGKTPLFTTRLEVSDFLHQMLLHKFFHRAKKVPVSEQELKARSKKKEPEKAAKSGDESGKDNKDGEKSQASACEGKEPKEGKDVKEKEKRSRKIRLEMHLEQVFVEGADAYVWIYDPIPPHYWLAGLAVLLGAIGVCMFPLWPPTVRKGVYYLSVAGAGFLVLIIGLAALRLLVFCTVWMLTLARHHLWLLPNLTEDVGFFASFWPLYKYEYRGPSSEPQPGKSKKKRKKEKLSDDEAAPAAASPSPASSAAAAAAPPSTASAGSAADAAAASHNSSPHSESESENSQRSSTERDFEIVDADDLTS